MFCFCTYFGFKDGELTVYAGVLDFDHQAYPPPSNILPVLACNALLNVQNMVLIEENSRLKASLSTYK